MESTFEKLDREIREAKSVLEAQDEALRGTVDRITADVDSKLDRDEMEMLRDYIGLWRILIWSLQSYNAV